MTGGTSKVTLVVTLAFLASYQLIHSFDVSGPFTVQIAVSLNITNTEFYQSVTPVRAWFLLPCVLLAGVLYEVIGYRTAIVSLSLGMGISTGLQAVAVLLNRGRRTTFALLRAAWGLSAISFASGFVVNSGMFALLPPSAYQAASSANSIAMMVGQLLSSFAGQALVHAVPRIGDLLYITLGVVALGLVLVLAGAISGVLPPVERVMSTKVWLSRVWQRFLFYHAKSEVLEWSSFSAVVLATHTLVKGMWKSLFHDIDPKSGAVSNGLINGATCLSAAVCMFLMSLAPKATERAARALLCLSPFVFAGMFAAMALSRTIVVGTVLLVAYNAVSECALVLGSVMMGKSMSYAEQKRIVDSEREPLLVSESPSSPLPDATVATTSAVTATAVSTQETSVQTGDGAQASTAAGDDGKAVEVEAKARKLVDFTLVFTVNALVSIIVQDAYNALAIYAFKLNSRGWFWGFGVLSVLLGVAVTISTIVHIIKNRRL